jgi:hypothetical protein
MNFAHGERFPILHWIGGWMGFTAILDVVVKIKVPLLL